MRRRQTGITSGQSSASVSVTATCQHPVMAFTGWPREAFDVLERLEGDPTPSERELVRADRESLVRQPMVELLRDLAERDPAYADHSVWHYRKIAWWWQNQSSRILIDRNVEIGVGFNLDGLRVQGAWWYGGPDQRERYRSAVAGRPGAQLQRIVDRLQGQDFEIGGDLMTRVPRNYPPDHRRAWLLRHRSLIASRHFGAPDWLHDASALDRLEETAIDLRPMLEWFSDRVVAIDQDLTG